MRNNILTLLVGFVVLLSSVLLFKAGLDKLTASEPTTVDGFSRVEVDLGSRAILYKVRAGDTLWGLAERFYGNPQRWVEIAARNEIKEGRGIVSGEIISIPLDGNLDETPISDDQLNPSPDNAREALAIPMINSLGTEAIGYAFCSGMTGGSNSMLLCVASEEEDRAIQLSLYDPAAGRESSPLDTWAAPKGSELQHLVGKDFDSDGRLEVVTFWRQGERSFLTRVFRVDSGKLEMVVETPEDPVAALWKRSAESQQE